LRQCCDLFGFALSQIRGHSRTVVSVAGESGEEVTGQIRVLGERLVYDGLEVRVSEVDLGLPDGDRLPWDVVRLSRSASVVLADARDRVLLVWRYRFTLDRWGWELPGGLVEEGEDPSETVARELEEVAGYRAGELAPVVSYQPEPRSVDGEHGIFAGRNPEPVAGAEPGEEAVRAEWVPAGSVRQLIAAGHIWAAGTLIGLLAVCRTAVPGSLPYPGSG
jgi:8-oxo-dGDP phosphatase